MDVDILKPDTGALQIERALQSSSRGTSSSERQESSGVVTTEMGIESRHYTEPVSEGEEDEEMDLAPGTLLCSLVYNAHSLFQFQRETKARG